MEFVIDVTALPPDVRRWLRPGGQLLESLGLCPWFRLSLIVAPSHCLEGQSPNQGRSRRLTRAERRGIANRLTSGGKAGAPLERFLRHSNFQDDKQEAQSAFWRDLIWIAKHQIADQLC